MNWRTSSKNGCLLVVYSVYRSRKLKKLDSKTDSSDDKVYTQADLFKESGIRRITIFCMYQWFATTLVYYGLSLGAGNLGGDLLVNNLLNGLVEFICYVFLPAFIDIKCIGRKYGIIITMTIGRKPTIFVVYIYIYISRCHWLLCIRSFQRIC